jgi:Tol biopolymer transport system component
VTVVVPSAGAKMGSASPSRRPAIKTRWAPLSLIGGMVVILLARGYWYLSRPLPAPRITAYTQITHDGREKALGGTDGSRLYFTQLSPNLIAQVGIHGGEIAQLSIPLHEAHIFLWDISPDGSNALISTFEEGRPLHGQWVVPVLGGAPKRLENADGGAFSPDGSSVIYSTQNGDIFLVHIDGSDKHKLASVGTVAYMFRWSPDGKVIRFSKQEGLWEMSSDGTGIHRLLPGWKGSVPCCGEWTREGGIFLLLAGHQIWALDERRNLFRRPSPVPIQLTSGPILWARALPGRDGKTLFTHGFTPRGELSRIDVKTGGSQPFLDGISAEFVSFSPDGKFVAYVAYPEGTLWKANRDGSNRMQLTQPPNNAANPRWSPDSKEILYMAVSPDGHWLIRRISSADGTPQWLMSGSNDDMSDPNWSPDGTKVVFSTGTLAAPEKFDLRIVDLNTRQVTVVPGSTGKWSPRWSPDGRYIAAFIRPQINHLPVFDLKLQRWLDLPVNGAVQFESFSHDSKFIYSLRCAKDQGVFRIPVTGGKEQRVVDMSGWHLTGYVGCSMSLDPTDAPLVLRDTGSDDIYALTLEMK